MIGCVILAAGLSRRFGEQNKLMFPVGGRPMAAAVMDAILGLENVDPVAVVADKDVAALAEARGIPVVYNPVPEAGISGSIRTGLSAFRERQGVTACLFAVADQPYLSTASIQTILACHRKEPETIVALSYGGRRGNPVLFPAAFFPELLALTGDTGGSAVIAANPKQLRLCPAAVEGELYDLDTVQALLDKEVRF